MFGYEFAVVARPGLLTRVTYLILVVGLYEEGSKSSRFSGS